MKIFKKTSDRGDTIVEIMVAITVLGLALSGSYALANRSYQTALHSRDRTEALALAQGQVEFLRNHGLNGTVGSLPTSTFCFNTAGNATTSGCANYNNRNYAISISYCGSGCNPQNVYTVRASWIAAGRGTQNQLTLYYKPPS